MCAQHTTRGVKFAASTLVVLFHFSIFKYDRGVTRTHLCDAKAQTRRQKREQQLHPPPRAHVAAQPRASSTDRAFMGARGSLLSSAVRAAEQRLFSARAPPRSVYLRRRYPQIRRNQFYKINSSAENGSFFPPSSFVTYNLLFFF